MHASRFLCAPIHTPIPPGRSRVNNKVSGDVAAFTLVELLTALVIIGVLVAIAIPAVSKVRSAGQRTACTSNLRQIGTAILAFTADNNGWLPGYNMIDDYWGLAYGLNGGAGPRWWTRGGKPTHDLISHLMPYFAIPIPTESNGLCQMMICPGNNKAGRNGDFASYYISRGVLTTNGVIRRPIGSVGQQSCKLNSIAKLPDAVALYDADAKFLTLLGDASTPAGMPPTSVHGSTHNVLYFDGHVSTIPKDINPHEKL